MDSLFQWLRGELSTTERVWSAIAPVLAISGYFALGLVLYVFRTLIFGRYHDEELEARGASFVLGPWLRSYFAWLMRPIWRLLYVLRVPPNAITTLALLLSLCAAVAVAAGRFALGGWLYICAGSCDFFDGRLARTTGRATRSGAALDSILDRYSEAAVLSGLAWYYRDSWVLLAVLLTMTGSFLVPYIRARGEALGVECNVGLMQRPERLALLGIAVALAPVLEAWREPEAARPMHQLAVVALLVLAVSTQFTAVRRLVHVMHVLGDARRPRLLSLDRGSLVRSGVAAAVATSADFLIVVTIVSTTRTQPEVATAIGCVLGGFLNFGINRIWTFGSSGGVTGQAARYTFVSATSAALNAAGVAVLLFLPDLDYRVAWILTRVAVFLGWNYPLQRDYIFVVEHPDVGQAGLPASR